jgi:hypothetical protein
MFREDGAVEMGKAVPEGRFDYLFVGSTGISERIVRILGPH